MARNVSFDDILAALEEHPDWNEPVQLWLAQGTLAGIRRGVEQLRDMNGENAVVADEVLESISTLRQELVALWSLAAQRVGLSADEAEKLLTGRKEPPPQLED